MPEDNSIDPPSGKLPGADIPDLKKKALERGQAGFAWAKDATIKPGSAGTPAAPALLAKVKAALRGKGAAFTVLMGLGMGAGMGIIGLATLEVRQPEGAKDNGLGGLFSSIRVRPGTRDRMRYLVGKTGILFGPSKGTQAKTDEETVVDEAAAGVDFEAPADGAAEEAGDAPSAPPATNSGSYMGGSTSAGSSGGGSGAPSFASDAPGTPNFSPAMGKTDLKGSSKVRRSRGTLGMIGERREVKGEKAAPGRKSWSGSSSTRGSGSGSAPGSAPSSLDYVLGGSETGASGPASAGGPGSSTEGGGGGSDPGTGGPGGGPNDAEDPNKVLKTIQSLLDKAASEGKKAEKEKKIALALSAAGQFPQAAYHYDRGEKAEKKSKEYASKAQEMAAAIGSEAGGGTANGSGGAPAQQP